MKSNHSNISSVKPNLFLVGAPKAGTTSIDRLLRKHQDVFLSPIKEPCYFCNDINKQIRKEYLRQEPAINLEDYLSQKEKKLIHLYIINNEKQYIRLFAGSNKSVVGECSTFYLSSKTAASNIYDYNKNSKIIAVLRDPAQRIRSHYDMDRRIGITDKPIIDLLNEELELGEKASLENSRYYIGLSKYKEQLDRYYSYFREDQIHIVQFEKLLKNQEKEIKRLFDFVDIEYNSAIHSLTKENKTEAVRFNKLNYYIYKTGYKPLIIKILQNILPITARRIIKSVYFESDKKSYVNKEEMLEINNIVLQQGLNDIIT
ncbi:MAG: sulfotransferase [Candidatus Thiodiazotropha endolucinida]|nr:sulfotransferase [Candidatus Thiodiazotropha taylori]MCW4318372.1 sulfotransferase [Candidatus Thiodiazotropha taylori]